MGDDMSGVVGQPSLLIVSGLARVLKEAASNLHFLIDQSRKAVAVRRARALKIADIFLLAGALRLAFAAQGHPVFGRAWTGIQVTYGPL